MRAVDIAEAVAVCLDHVLGTSFSDSLPDLCEQAQLQPKDQITSSGLMEVVISLVRSLEKGLAEKILLAASDLSIPNIARTLVRMAVQNLEDGLPFTTEAKARLEEYIVTFIEYLGCVAETEEKNPPFRAADRPSIDPETAAWGAIMSDRRNVVVLGLAIQRLNPHGLGTELFSRVQNRCKSVESMTAQEFREIVLGIERHLRAGQASA
ncbi:MAG TPA: hypothetical protein VFQ60_03475 [Patescibacteria group bacterium]|nr:hypothetical protein [Patescibacteria group bacterium]